MHKKVRHAPNLHLTLTWGALEELAGGGEGRCVVFLDPDFALVGGWRRHVLGVS